LNGNLQQLCPGNPLNNNSFSCKRQSALLFQSFFYFRPLFSTGCVTLVYMIYYNVFEHFTFTLYRIFLFIYFCFVYYGSLNSHHIGYSYCDSAVTHLTFIQILA